MPRLHVVQYLALVRQDAPQHVHNLREIFNGLRWIVRTGSLWRYLPNDLPPWEAVYQQSQGWIWAGAFEGITGDHVEIAFIDQGYTGDEPAEDAKAHGVELHVVKHPEAKRGFVLLPRRWGVERSFGWMSRFRRLALDYERLPHTLAGLHFVAFATLMLGKWFSLLAST